MPDRPSHHPRSILITGASGVVGAPLLRELGGERVISLTHRQPVPGHCVQVRGDLGTARLGLSRQEYRTLAAQVGTIVHCAAVTDFGAGAQATHDLNVRGTEHVVALAEQSGALLHHVSTAFVRRRALTSPADGAAPGTSSPEDYLDSKRAAEQVVLDSGQPGTIIRPSVVIGDSVTGDVARFQGLHSILGAVMRRTLPMVPLPPDVKVDFVPQDLLARAIAGLVRAGTSSGQYWVTAGHEALTAVRTVELAVDTARRLGLRVDPPRLVDADIVDRLIRPVFIDPLPAADRRRFDELLAMAALFDTPEPFETSLEDVPGVRPPTTTELESALVASLLHYAEVKGLVAREVAA